MARRKKQTGPDPLQKFKRALWAQANGLSDEERLDLYLHKQQEEVRPERNARSAEYDFLGGRIKALRKKLGLDYYITHDGRFESLDEDLLSLSNMKDVRRFRRFVKAHLGPEAAKDAVLVTEKYSANPKVTAQLGPVLKHEFCRKYGKTRHVCQAATDKTQQAKR